MLEAQLAQMEIEGQSLRQAAAQAEATAAEAEARLVRAVDVVLWLDWPMSQTVSIHRTLLVSGSMSHCDQRWPALVVLVLEYSKGCMSLN